VRYAILPAAAAVLTVAVAAPVHADERSASFGLRVGEGGVLLKGDRPWRGLGVNYFDLFARTLRDEGDTSYRNGLAALGERGIPFARFMCGGFWPADWRLYREDRAAYFRRLDAVLAAAEKHGVGLIPSLFWHVPTVPDLVGEPCSAWGDTASATHGFMRTYVREVVTRYRASPAVWGWEFGNEYNLAADLPNAARHRPKTVPRLGTPETRSARDDLTREMIRTAFAAFAREVRRHDPHRIITTGNSIPRPSAWHQVHEGTWGRDTPAQFAEILPADHPDPVNVISVHGYRENVERIAPAAEVAREAGKPLFVGEFGVQGPATPGNRKAFERFLEEIDRCGVPMAALWVYDYARQAEWHVTASNERSWQLDAIAASNARLRERPLHQR